MSPSTEAPIDLEQVDDDRVRLTTPTWPARTWIVDFLRKYGNMGPPLVLLWNGNLLTIRVSNGHAVYRLGKRKRGVWQATLVEGWVYP